MDICRITWPPHPTPDAMLEGPPLPSADAVSVRKTQAPQRVPASEPTIGSRLEHESRPSESTEIRHPESRRPTTASRRLPNPCRTCSTAQSTTESDSPESKSTSAEPREQTQNVLRRSAAHTAPHSHAAPRRRPGCPGLGGRRRGDTYRTFIGCSPPRVRATCYVAQRRGHP